MPDAGDRVGATAVELTEGESDVEATAADGSMSVGDGDPLVGDGGPVVAEVQASIEIANAVTHSVAPPRPLRVVDGAAIEGW